MTADFPADFLWGVATAGHQNEGDNTASDTWFLERVTPTVFRERSGKAVDGYRLWRRDLDLAAGLGLNAFRFSTEWARIEPEEGRFDEAALDHYEAVVDGCLERGLAPCVTLGHFTAPHWFAKQGAWLDDGAADRFARFCGTVMDRMGDRLASAVTLNEPNLPRLLSWVVPDLVNELTRATLRAASEAAGVPHYRSANVVQPEDLAAMESGFVRAHRAARAVIEEHRPELPVGLSIAIVDDVADGDPTLRDRKRAEVYDPWLRLAREDDFVGVQNYERIHYGPDGPLPPRDGAVLNDLGSAVEPGSLAATVRYAHRVAQVPVFVTEHGISTQDDQVRSRFVRESLEGLRAVIDDGVPVLGYLHWTLLDNFEWISGFDGHLGLFAVDRVTYERVPKPSAAEYRRLVGGYRGIAAS